MIDVELIGMCELMMHDSRARRDERRGRGRLKARPIPARGVPRIYNKLRMSCRLIRDTICFFVWSLVSVCFPHFRPIWNRLSLSSSFFGLASTASHLSRAKMRKVG